MGFGDKLKGLRDQAQQAVAENRDKIQDAVQVVGEAANAKTHGKYAAKIAQVGAKVEQSVDRVAEATPPAAGAPSAPGPVDPSAPAPGAAAPPDPAVSIEDGPPTEDSMSAPIVHEPPRPVAPSAADEAASGFPEFE